LLRSCDVLLASFRSLLFFCGSLVGGFSSGLVCSVSLSHCLLLGCYFGVFGGFFSSLLLAFRLSHGGLPMELSLPLGFSLSLGFSLPHGFRLPLSFDMSRCGCLCLPMCFDLSLDLRLPLVLLPLCLTHLLTLSSLCKFLCVQEI